MGAMRRGSVMMEFIIVFPIYLVLFATMFILGDMLIHSNRLAFGNVVNAFCQDVGDGYRSRWDGVWDDYAKWVYPSSEITDDADMSAQDVFYPIKDITQAGSLGRVGYYADAGGSWVVCAASRVVDRYRPLAGGALGQLLSAEFLLGGTPDRVDGDRSAIDDWRVPGGRVNMRAKGGNILFESIFKQENDLRSHSFYVLKRNRTGHYDTGNWRRMTSGLLKDDRWIREVCNDGWYSGKTITDRYTNGGSDSGDDIVNGYDRYERFEDWSE